MTSQQSIYKVTTCCIATYIYKYMRNIIKDNEELQWTNALLYKNIFLTLYSGKGDVCCVWEMSWWQGQTAILTQVLLAIIAELLLDLGWSCSTVQTEGPKPSVYHWLSHQHLVSNGPEPSGHLVILSYIVHLLPLFFRLYTLVHFLIDGSVEGQYITIIPYLLFKIPHVEIFITSISIPLTHTFYK